MISPRKLLSHLFPIKDKDEHLSPQRVRRDHHISSRVSRLYQGFKVWSGEDAWGVVEVVEDDLGRRLHFGNDSIQGRIYPSAPWWPVSEYMRSISVASTLISHHSTPRILLLGLGAVGSVHTFYHLYPNAHIDVIELRPLVIELAHTYFQLDRLPTVQVWCEDAMSFIQRVSPRSYDLIIVDLFLREGMINELLGESLWTHCAQAMDQGGLLCVNTWSGSPQRFYQIAQNLQRSFKHPICSLDHDTIGNLIIFAQQTPFNWSMAQRSARAIDLQLAPPFHVNLNNASLKKLKLNAGLTSMTVSTHLNRLIKRDRLKKLRPL